MKLWIWILIILAIGGIAYFAGTSMGKKSASTDAPTTKPLADVKVIPTDNKQGMDNARSSG